MTPVEMSQHIEEYLGHVQPSFNYMCKKNEVIIITPLPPSIAHTHTHTYTISHQMKNSKYIHHYEHI